jgi:hypothetical protein
MSSPPGGGQAGSGGGGSGGDDGSGGAIGDGGGMDTRAPGTDGPLGGDRSPLCTPVATEIFEDDFSVGSEWTTETITQEGTASQMVMQQASGGNPGGFRRMTHTLGPPPGVSMASFVWVAHLYTGGTYDPVGSGAVCALVYREDQIDQSNPIQVMWGVVVMQGGVKFIHRPDPQFNHATWTRRGPYVLVPSDFTPAPGPDFSAQGEPMVFGYLRANSTSNNPTQSQTINHGIDNWRLEVQHR